MNYEFIDMNAYKRKSHFDYFCGLPSPYVGLTVQVDFTKFAAAIKKKGLPFFLSFCYCIAEAANSVPEFKQRIMDGQIAEYKHCKTSHTVSLEAETYCYCTLSSDMPFQSYPPYAVQAQEDAKAVKSTEDQGDDKHELFFSQHCRGFPIQHSLIRFPPLRIATRELHGENTSSERQKY